MGRAGWGRPLEASRGLLATWGLTLALIASPANSLLPCFNVDAVYGDWRNTTRLWPNGGFVVSAKACQQACEARGPFCKYFSWMRNPDPSKHMGKGACWAHEDVKGLLGKATTISGPQGCDPGDAGGAVDVEEVTDVLAAGAFPGVEEVRSIAAASAAVTSEAPQAATTPAQTVSLPGTLEPVPTLPPLPTLPAPGALPTLPPVSPGGFNTRAPAVAPGGNFDILPGKKNGTGGVEPATTAAPPAGTAAPPAGTVAPPAATTAAPPAATAAPPATTAAPWGVPAATAAPPAATAAPPATTAAPWGVPAATAAPPATTAAPAGVPPATAAPPATTAAPAGVDTVPPAYRNDTNGTEPVGTVYEEVSSFPWWGYLLLALGAALCCGVTMLFACGDKKATKKKKKVKRERSMELEDSFESTDREAAPMLNVQTRQAAPMLNVQTRQAAPMLNVQTRQGPDLFDQIDRNHDGKISEAEFMSAMGAQAPAAPVAASVQLQPRAVLMQQPTLVARPPAPSFQPLTATQRSTPSPAPQSPDLFDIIDRNHDGRITGAEWAAAMGAQAKPPPPQPPAHLLVQTQRATVAQPVQHPDLFDIIDRNHDGRITGAEWAAAMGTQAAQAKAAAPPPPPQPQRAVAAQPGQRPDLFDLIDRNHDGRITGSEWAAAMGTQAPQAKAPAPQPAPPQQQQPLAAQSGQGPDLFDAIDRNHDGRITGAEWAAAMGGQAPRLSSAPPYHQPHPLGSLGRPAGASHSARG